MADVSQNVIIDFQLQNQQLQATIDMLGETNQLSADSVNIYKQVNGAIAQNTATVEQNQAALSEQQITYDKLSKSLISLSGAAKKNVQDLLELKPEQIAAGFQQLNISVDDYLDILKQAGTQQDKFVKQGTSVRAELKNITQQLASLTLAGQENTAEFTALASRAGELKNALKDTSQVVNTLGSDAPKVALFAGAVRGIGAAFQGSTAAAALFGAENKDLEEVLVKVNAAMALSQALNEAVNLVSDKALITSAKQLALQKVQLAQETIQNGLESESIVIRTAATVAQKALNAVMAINPLVLVIAAVVAFVAAIYEYTQATKKAVEETEAFNAAMDSATKDLDAYTQGLQDAADKQNAALKDQGAAQSTILKNTGSNLAIQRQGIIDEIAKLDAQLDILQKSNSKTAAEDYKKASDQILKLQQQQDKINTEQVKNGIEQRRALVEEDLNNQVALASGKVSGSSQSGTGQFAAQRQLLNAQAALALEGARGNADKQFEINQKLQRDITENVIAEEKFRQDNVIAIDQTGLTKVEQLRKASSDRVSQAEVDAQNKLDHDTLVQSLLNLKLTSAERLNLITQTNAKIADRNRDFAKQQSVFALQDQDSLAKVTLANQQLNLKQQLGARIVSIEDEAQIEIIAARDNADKVREIEAKRDADILQARKDAINQAAAHELAVFNATNAAELRAITKSLADQQAIQSNDEGLGGANRAANRLGTSILSPEAQKAQIDRSAQIQAAAIKIQQQALIDDAALTGSFNDSELEQFKSLQDQETQIFEDAKNKQDAIDEAARKKQRDRTIAEVNLSVGAVQDGLNILGSLYQQQDQAANDRLAAQKQRVQDELDAGNISAKEAANRQKQLDVQQKKLQYDQAKRQKTLALFQATINTALAITNAIVTGDPYTAALRAAIAAAIGGAEIALIASKPLPQFNKGKKDGWSGLGLVGERGAEIVERDGRMHLVSQATPMYLGPTDKVYTPAETMNMMENMSFGNNLKVDSAGAHAMAMTIDYERFGESVARNIPQYGMNITENGLQEWVKKGNTTTKYLNKRRRFGSK